MKNDITQKPVVYANATAHLDTVWNWTLEDTVKDHLVRTLHENFHLFENYPDYRFNFEGAYRYDLIKEYYPEDYERLKGYIADGKWFVTGSGWENGDVVVSSPEALMRNILYGNKFFQKEFGKKSNDIFLPDCFGFAYTLPTIMNHMGLTAFSSAKLIWNTGNKVPFEVGVWKGIDGSEVVAALDPGQYVTRVDEMWSRNEKLCEHVDGLPTRKTFKYYGVGDIGGAPTEGSTKYICESVNDKDGLIEVISSYAGQLADELTPEERSQLPVFDGELLMTTHGVGSYTSVAPTKRFNKKNELIADFAERVNVFAEWLGLKSYPKEKMDEAWKMVIRHQFHDDITGTSLQRVYKDTFTDYITSLNQFVHELATAGENIADCIDTSKIGEGIPVVVFNGVTVSRKDVVVADIDYGQKTVPEYIQVFDCDGKETACQILEKNGNILKIAFVAEVLSDGYSTFRVFSANAPCKIDTGLSVSEKCLESNLYKVSIDENGNVASIFDKVNKKEILSEPIRYEVLGNSYVSYGAWEILHNDVMREPRSVVGGTPEIKIIENGPARVALEIVRKDTISTYKQTVMLTANSPYVNVENNINWLEPSAFLKVALPFTLSNDKATYDMGLGTIDRGNNEEMKYEVPVHQWANLKDSESNYSVTVMSDCKYAMDKPNNNIMRITAIHTPQNKFLDATRQDLQDFGENRFAYSIMGREGGWRECHSAAEAAKYNQPLIAVQTNSHGGILPLEFSFISVNTEKVSVKAVKPAEDTDEIIIRVCEAFGETVKDVKLQVAGGIESAREVNGYEDHIGEAKVVDGVLVFDIDRYTPKTFAIKLAKCTVGLSQKEYETIMLGADTPISTTNERRGEYGFGKEKTTIPAEFLQSKLIVGGVPFSVETDSCGIHCALLADGQTIKLPYGTSKLYFTAISLNNDKKAVFKAGDKDISIRIQSYDSYVGGWDQYGSDHYGYIKHDVIAYNAPHTHDVSGDKVYGKFCMFKYEIDIPAGVDSITLPKDKDILVVSATALMGTSFSKMKTQIIDVKEKRIPRTLKVKDGSGGGVYVEGNPVSVIYTGNKVGEVIWESSDGEKYFGAAFEISMPDKDFSLVPHIKEYGTNLAATGIAVSNTEVEPNTAYNAIDGRNNTLWKALSVKNSWIIVDLGEMKTFDTIMIKHAAAGGEANVLNTVQFDLQVFENEEWRELCAVKENRVAITSHAFERMSARYLRMVIRRPTRSESDKFARVYGFEVYDSCEPVGKNISKDTGVTPFDVIDIEGDGTIVYKGIVETGKTINIGDRAYIKKWSVSNMSDCTVLAGSDEVSLTEVDCAVRKKFDNIQRIVKGFEAEYIKLEGSKIDSGKACELTLVGKSLSMAFNNKWPADRAGTRNNHAVVNMDGTVFLPKYSGSGHDIFGLETEIKAGPIRLYMCIKVSDEELADAPDSLELFKFNPILPGGDVLGERITVADYKAAMENEEGYKIVSSDFILAANGRIEGRIVNARNLDMMVSEFGVYESQE